MGRNDVDNEILKITFRQESLDSSSILSPSMDPQYALFIKSCNTID